MMTMMMMRKKKSLWYKFKGLVSDLQKLHANNAINNELLKKGQSMVRLVSILSMDIPSVGIPTYLNEMIMRITLLTMNF